MPVYSYSPCSSRLWSFVCLCKTRSSYVNSCLFLYTFYNGITCENLRGSPSTFLSGGSKIIRRIIAQRERAWGQGYTLTNPYIIIKVSLPDVTRSCDKPPPPSLLPFSCVRGEARNEATYMHIHLFILVFVHMNGWL